MDVRTPASSGSPCRNRSRKRVGPLSRKRVGLVPSVARPVSIDSPSDRTTLASLAPWTIRLSEISGIDEDTGIGNMSHGSPDSSRAVTGRAASSGAAQRGDIDVDRATVAEQPPVDDVAQGVWTRDASAVMVCGDEIRAGHGLRALHVTEDRS